MTTAKLAPSNGQPKDVAVVVPDLAAVMAKLDRLRFDAEHDLAREYLHQAAELVYAAAGYRRERAGVSDRARREWMYRAAEFAERAAEFAYNAAALAVPAGEADDGQPF